MNALHFATRAARYIRRNGRYWTARKLANASLASLALRARLRRNPAMPVVIKLEATNVCNGSCRLCPVGQKRPSGRGGGMMDWSLFTALIEQLRSTAVVCDLTNWGESLLHPRALDMVAHAHDAGLYTYLSTNLHTVRDQHVEALCDCGLDELTLSLHGLDEPSYQAYQPGYSFAEADALIRRLAAACAPGGRPKITLNFVVTRHNEHQLDELAAYAEALGVGYAASAVSLNLRFDVDRRMVRHEPRRASEIIAAACEQWLPRGPGAAYARGIYPELVRRPELMYSPRKRMACDWPWRRLVVNYDGALSICCGSYHAVDDLGRFTGGESIAELWNAPAYRACRESFSRRAQRAHDDCDCEQADGPREPLCAHCPGVLL